jgi:homoaconitase/3-isopropylmalate dehydratase large subunit
VDENNVQKTTNRKWLIVAAGVFGVSLITAGVFASTQITINGSSHTVNLGAGSATVQVCGSTATISALQTYNSASQSFHTTTFSVTGIGSGCAGKVLSLAFSPTTGSVNTATWTVPTGENGSTTFQYGYGSNGGSCTSGSTCQAQSSFTDFDTYLSNLSTVAIAVQ